jgi:hypothetical protein
VQQERDVALPWKHEFTAPEGFSLLTVTATRGDITSEDKLSCRITVDGEEVDKTDGGTFTALCFGTISD